MWVLFRCVWSGVDAVCRDKECFWVMFSEGRGDCDGGSGSELVPLMLHLIIFPSSLLPGIFLILIPTVLMVEK